MEAGSSRSGGMPQVRCSASASQNVPGVRYLQRPRSQGRQVCGSGQVNSFVSSREGSIASLPLLLSGSFIRFYGRCCTPRRRPIDKAASLVKYTMHMVFLFCDCPQVLLPALPHTARKGECEGGTLDGFPHSRSITRPQATTFARKSAAPKKERHPHGCLSFFGAGDEARTRYLDLGKVALYQMSYARKRRRCCGTLVPPVGVEPTTRGFSVRCSTN